MNIEIIDKNNTTNIVYSILRYTHVLYTHEYDMFDVCILCVPMFVYLCLFAWTWVSLCLSIWALI